MMPVMLSNEGVSLGQRGRHNRQHYRFPKRSRISRATFDTGSVVLW
jgi:hypothetical protein